MEQNGPEALNMKQVIMEGIRIQRIFFTLVAVALNTLFLLLQMLILQLEKYHQIFVFGVTDRILAIRFQRYYYGLHYFPRI